ncbi:hypothetical protein D3C85_1051400 [compost metagenome]
MILRWADVVVHGAITLTEGFQRLLPEVLSQGMTMFLFAVDAFFLILLGHHSDHKIGRLRRGDNLLTIEEQLVTRLIGRYFETLAGDSKLTEPQHRISNFFAITSGDKDQPLCLYPVDLCGFQSVDLQKLDQAVSSTGRWPAELTCFLI